MGKLITTVIQWALFLGVSGGLVDTTIEMRREAARAEILLKVVDRVPA